MISFSVSQRTPELGIRRALGAKGKNIIKIVSRQAGLQLVLGLGIGIAGSAAASQVMKSIAVVSVGNPRTCIGVGAALIFSMVVGCIVPTLRFSSY